MFRLRKTVAAAMSFIFLISPLAPAMADVATSAPVEQAPADASAAPTADAQPTNDTTLSAPQSTTVQDSTLSTDLGAAPVDQMAAPDASALSAPTAGAGVSQQTLSSGQVAAIPNAGDSTAITLNKPGIQSNTGALTYSYPIPLPQGRGYTPDLSLDYNNQSNFDKGLGVGWSLSIPYIERVPKHGIDVLYSEDNYTSSLSGELSKIDSTHYGAKREHGDFLDFQLSSNVWTVSTKTGLTYVYGKAATERLDDPSNTSHVFRWMLSEIVDSNNNVVKYAYYKDSTGGDIYPSTITYPIWRDPNTGTETSPIFTVTFNRSDRTTYNVDGSNHVGTPTGYRSGFSVKTAYIMTSIVISKSGSVSQPFNRSTYPANNISLSSSRTYSITYTRSDDLSRALLSSVTPSWKDNANATITGQPTTFDYSKIDSAARKWADETWQFPSATGTDAVYFPQGLTSGGAGSYGNSRLVDVDGDGLADLLSVSTGYRNTGSGWQQVSGWSLPSLSYPNNQNCPTGSFQISLGGNGNKFQFNSDPVRFADLNGDGRQDLIVINAKVHCGQTDVLGTTGIFFGGPNGWTQASSWSIPTGSGTDTYTINFTSDPQYDQGYRLADINGDGLTDIIQSDVNSIGTSTFHLFLNNGSGWVPSNAFSLPTIGWCNTQNGVVNKKLGFVDTGEATQVPISFADVNNDGLPDLLLDGGFCTNLNYTSVTPQGSNAVFLNTGTTWTYASPLTPYASTAPQPTRGDHYINGDFNGDGLSPDLPYARNEVASDVGGQYNNEGVLPVEDYANNSDSHFYPTISTAPQWTFPKRNGCTWPSTVNKYRVSATEPVPWYNYNGSQPNPNPLLSAWQIADLDGDGMADFMDVNAVLPCDVYYVTGDYGSGYGTYYFNGNYHKFTDFQRETKFWRNQAAKSDQLSVITFPHGGTSTITYSMSATLTDETGAHIDANSPVNQAVVTQISETGGDNQPAVTTTYSYAGAYYRSDTPDSHESTGFRRVIKKDANGATTTTWFHQGDGNDAASYEMDDSASSTTGLPYRVEKRDSAGALRALTVTQYQNTAAPSLAGDRYFTAAATETDELAEADGTTGWKASVSSYDPSNGNLLKTVDYGDVTGSASGTFTDSGNDAVVTTSYSYANTDGSVPHDVGFVCQKLTTDQNSNVIGRERAYYDNLSLGNVLKGNGTGANQLIASPGGVDALSTTASSFDVTGLLTSSTDELGTLTTYGYDSNKIYAATSTRMLGATPFLTKYFYQWTLGTKVAETAPSGLSSMTDIDGYGRPLRRSVIMSGESGLHGKESWVYDDTSPQQTYSSPGSIVTHTRYATDAADISADSVRDAVEISYTDGLDREIRHVRMFPDPSGGTTAAPALVDTVYDNRGMTQKTALAFSGTPGAITAPWRSGTVASPTDSRRWVVNAYDDMGRVSSVTSALGTTTNAYGARSTTATDPLSRSKTLLYDARRQLTGVQEKNREGGSTWHTYTTSYAYDPDGNLVTLTDADGNVRNFGYDLINRRTSAEDLHAPSDSTYGSSSFAYDNKGDLMTLTNPDSTQVVTTYDGFGRPQTKEIGSSTWSYTYDSCANGVGLLCQEQLNGTTTALTYDSRGRVATKKLTTGGIGQNESYAYNMQDQPTVTTLADGSSITRDYAAGALMTLSTKEKTGSAVPAVNAIAYAADGKVASMTYATGAIVTNTYDADAMDRLVRKQTVYPAIQQTASFYSASGDGHVYNSNGTWSTAHDASTGSSASYTGASTSIYTAHSTVHEIMRGFMPFNTSALPDDATILGAKLKLYALSTTDADNDGDDWITVVQTTQSSTTTLVTSDFSKDGAATNPTEGIDTSERKDITNISTNQYQNFTMNATGISWISKTGSTMLGLREGHDVINSALSVSGSDKVSFATTEAGGTSTDPILDVTYHPYGTHGTITTQDVSYTYNAVNDITGVTDVSQTGSAKSVAYTYDDLDRLLSTTAVSASSTPLYAESYTYGPTGNLLTKSVTSGTGTAIVSTYAYAGSSGSSYANPQAVTSITPSVGNLLTLGYDQNGNLTSSGSSTYAWNPAGQMASATVSGTTTSFVYDPDGTRLSSAVGALLTLFPSRDETTVMNGSATSSREKRVYANGLLVATLRGVSDATATLDVVSTDHLTGSSVMSDGNGNLDELIDYLPYGGIRIDQKTGSFNERAKFAGHMYDDSTGLSYQGARYYDASTGRFLSEDPVFLTASFNLTDPQSLNSYAYARNNPLVYIDTDGRAYTLAQFASSAGGYAVGFGQGAARFVGSTASALAHPVQTFNNIGDASASAGRAFGSLVRNYQADPQGTMSLVSSAASTAYGSFEGSSPYEQGRTIGNLFGQVSAGVAASGLLNGALSTTADIDTSAHSAANGLNLGKQLGSEAQMSELMGGKGEVIAGAGSTRSIDDISRITNQYGGTNADWAKISSSSYSAADGTSFQTHAYQNVSNGSVVEPKVKFTN